MSAMRTRAAKAGVAFLAAIGMAALLCLLWASPAVSAEEPAATRPRGLDAETHARIVHLREQLQLSNAALATMGMPQSDAEGILSRLLSWHETNQTTWTARRTAAAATQKVMRDALRRLSVGSGNAGLRSELAHLRAAVVTAKQQEEALLAGLRQQIEAVLTDSQKTVWATIRANPASAGQYVCAPSITAAQLKGLAAARARHARKDAVARTNAARAAAAAALARAERGILSDTQRIALAAARANIDRCLPGVLAASQKVLPRPADPDDAAMAREQMR